MEELIETKKIDQRHPGAQLALIVRYLYHEKGLRESGIVKWVDSFMEEAYEYYNADNWYKTILSYISRGKKRPLIKVGSVPITQNEIEAIKTVGNERREKLLFTLLCLAKYNNIYKGRAKNNDWVNFNDTVIFKCANVSGSTDVRDGMIYDLKESGMVKNNKSLMKLNIQVCIVDDDSPAIFEITDMTNLGLQYLYRKGDKYVRICKKCGKYFRAQSVNKLNCPSCERQPIGEKVINCSVCGEEITVSAHDTRTTMCRLHRLEYEQEQKKEINARYYEKHKDLR